MSPPFTPQIRLFQDWIAETRGLRFNTYEEFWRWSVTDLDAFWRAIWEYDQMLSPTPFEAALVEERMPGAVWFRGGQVNYAAQVLRHVEAAEGAGLPAIIAEDERGLVREMSWPELRRQVASLALNLRALGVGRGDRVVAYLPNVPEAAVAFLAVVSLGAIWSICAPDMGQQAVTDRFAQIEPKVLIAVDGVHYAGKSVDRSGVVQALRAALPTVEALVLLETPHAAQRLPAELRFAEATARNDAETASFAPEWVPFEHPIWVVYSSGTTGLPKPIVHGHGGVILTAFSNGKHNDVGCSYDPNSFGERYHWYSSTGWIMWNAQISGLLTGTTICIFDGSPSGSKDNPDWGVLWRFAARHRVTFLGAGAAYYANCRKAGLDIAACGDVSAIRGLGSTGSPLAEDVQHWGSEAFAKAGTPDIWWYNVGGGTDIAGAFCTGHRELPPTPGSLQCRQLGAAVEAFDEGGNAVTDAVGELVCTRPLPGMPIYFWNDPGNARHLSSYFDVYPGIWRHGDWLKVSPEGTCTIYGRSDATINRFGLRLGASEIYSAVEGLPEVLDSMVIDLEYLGRDSWMVLFVALRPGQDLDAAMRDKINGAIRVSVSPRFLPDEILHAPEIPRTLSGKKQEVPIKKLYLGHKLEKVINREAMANPDCLSFYIPLASAHAAKSGA